MTETWLRFGPFLLVPARDGRGIRAGYWVLPAVRHPHTGVWYSPTLSTGEAHARALRHGWSVTFTEVEIPE
ncbi:hypothetical protein UFOVP821_14 [uncultured Caudovirales phage]|uniref:Uncharacterized protein n=1 Tax=uncultured Caudovirales phage TaxID=2100421 RepID=A0A6J5NZT9_9CAUD|nr:hypothetical protein UFOVP821_14 [uncultured Caudovirales phage]